MTLMVMQMRGKFQLSTISDASLLTHRINCERQPYVEPFGLGGHKMQQTFSSGGDYDVYLPDDYGIAVSESA